MAQNPEKGRRKTPAEQRKDFFDSRLPELLKETIKAQEARRKLGEIIREASDSFVLTQGKVRDISGRDQILKELFEELDKLKISEQDREKYFIETRWTNKKRERKHQLFLRNDIALQIAGKKVTFTPEEVTQMQDFILQMRALQNEISNIMANPEHTIDLSQQAGETQEERAERIAREDAEKNKTKSPETAKALRESEKILNPEDNPYERVRKEATGGAIKILEQKTGRSLEFSPDQYSHIQKYLNERFADVMALRAEDYLRRKKAEVAKRGIDPDSKGAAAVQAVESLGATKEIIEGDRELEKLHTVLTALSEFSSGDIPPSARFAILEQLNQLPDSEEVKKLRVEVFQKWSGREPDSYTTEMQANILFYTEILPQREEAIRKALSDEDRAVRAEFGINENYAAYLKALGYQFKPLRKSFFGYVTSSRLKLVRGGNEVPVASISESEARTQWVSQVKTETNNQIRERVKLDLTSEFAFDVTNLSASVLKKRYENLRHDIDTEYTRKVIEGNKEGEKVTEETDEALAETGKGATQFVRSMIAGEGGFGSLSGEVEKDKDALLKELKDNWGLDVSLDQFNRFVKESGMDYNLFSKKRQGLVYFMLRLASHAFQEAKKITI